MTKHKINPTWFLIIGLVFLIVPTAVYLGFLAPRLQERYIILMSSGGVIGSAGMFGSAMIPDKTKYGTLYKTASKSFTLLVVITLVQEFIGQLIGLAAVMVGSYIVFIIFKELWKHGRRKRQDAELAKEVAQSISNATE